MKIKGINHLAMVTGDMDKTVRFYRDILGFPVVATIGNRPDSYPYRHYFFDIGPDTTLAFFRGPAAAGTLAVRPPVLQRGDRGGIAGVAGPSGGGRN